MIPSRMQSVAELAYGFCLQKWSKTICGKEGVKYFPYIMTLFMFIVCANFLGLIPTSFTPTSHFAVTVVLALAVFLTVTILGFVKNGAAFLGLFWVSSAPLPLRPVLAIIELISYFVRPVSHSIRLAGNVMAGHAVIKVFAGFAAITVISPVSVVAITAMYGLEVLVSFIQAYVFTISDMRVSERRIASVSLIRAIYTPVPNTQLPIVRRIHMEGELAHIGRRSGSNRFRRSRNRGWQTFAGNYLAGALRNPSAAASQTATLFIGIAFAEALGIFSFLVALLLMFAV